MNPNDVINWLFEHIGYPLATALGVGAQWLINKRKNTAEAKHVEIDNDGKVIDKWIQWSEKMERNLHEVQQELTAQRMDCDKETRQLQQQISQHERRIFLLEAENNHLKTQVGDT